MKKITCEELQVSFT